MVSCFKFHAEMYNIKKAFIFFLNLVLMFKRTALRVFASVKSTV